MSNDFLKNTSKTSLYSKKPQYIIIENVRKASIEEVAIACSISLMQGFYEKFIRDTMFFIDSDKTLSHKQKKKVKKYTMNTYTPLILSERIINQCAINIDMRAKVFYIDEETVKNIYLVTDRFLKKHFSRYNSFGTSTAFFSTLFFEFKDRSRFTEAFNSFHDLRNMEILLANVNIATLDDLVREKRKQYQEKGMVFEDCLEDSFVKTELDRAVKLSDIFLNIFKSENDFIKYANKHRRFMSDDERKTMNDVVLDTKSSMSEKELRKKYDS